MVKQLLGNRETRCTQATTASVVFVSGNHAPATPPQRDEFHPLAYKIVDQYPLFQELRAIFTLDPRVQVILLRGELCLKLGRLSLEI